jgi:hypothetical protein
MHGMSAREMVWWRAYVEHEDEQHAKKGRK